MKNINEKSSEPYFTKDEAKFYANLLTDASNSDGMNRKILEAESLRVNLKLAETSIKNTKNSFRNGIILVLIGALFGLIPTIIDGFEKKSEEKLLDKLNIDKKVFENSIQLEFDKLRLKITSLEEEILFLKSQKNDLKK
ncbi:hypothetical protein LNJ05_12740 [Tenacibaculum finnmarkense genomovar ulcerans]|uniref:hypothetical protein n=1 Tax=Tenacibaculum finnmarkense TaxID=2781243 RepID=UPI001E3936BA|nr:hypothetical protein [Tenacibaculum finnmarkense]MCD8433631.1 hypothetical protein [Tenacibaculum finnmarkense genomovar ulcerans]MCG8236270.1 hypothetical protein [Tenacibaculum finnmarkense genomovar ulcerans]MCG8808918.1 hypothetical protein [Tenacibaculum finnmarkense]MCG8819158.1 hypothetical protein [Tenacibaculum finnmarkense]MCG8831451.1 hypothetical protein [Tenacibaculum finnmarkense]